MRRILAVASLVLALLVPAASVAAAEQFHFTGQGNWAYATFTNAAFDENGSLPPGDYFYTDLWASRSIVTGDATYEDSGVCVFSQTFSIAADGNWVDGTWVGACGPADLSIARRLTGATLSASLPVEECIAWDEQTKDCLEIVPLGTLAVDLAFAGTGPTYRYHGSSTGGIAGYYQYIQHGTGLSREANVAGSITLTAPDESVMDLTGGVDGHGAIQQSKDGYVEVVIGR